MHDSSTSKVAIIRGAVLNKWEMQNFEPLADEWNVLALGTEPGQYSTADITLPIRRLRPANAVFQRLGMAARVAARLGVVKQPSQNMVGLEDALAAFAIAHAAETSIPYSEQAIRAKQRHGCKIVLTCWETIPFAYQDDVVVRERCGMVREDTDLFLATTRRAARALEIEGVARERIRVVMPGVDVQRFRPGSREPEMMARYGVVEDDIVLLFIGRLIREKGAREILVALSLALRALSPPLARRCRLLIAGSGPQRDFLQSLIGELGLAEHARIVGGMDYMQIHRLHQMADVFVLPSIATPYWEEQYGMVLAEAMACGTPIVSTHTGGIPEVVGDAGLLVPQLEPDALCEALVRLIRDEDLRQELSHEARERAVTHFNAADVAARMSDAYQHVLSPVSASAVEMT